MHITFALMVILALLLKIHTSPKTDNHQNIVQWRCFLFRYNNDASFCKRDPMSETMETIAFVIIRPRGDVWYHVLSLPCFHEFYIDPYGRQFSETSLFSEPGEDLNSNIRDGV